MTIKDVSVSSTKEFFDVLEELRLKGLVFRGQRDVCHRISSTLSRHDKAPYNPRSSWQVDGMLRHFLGNLKLVNHSLPFAEDNRRARLEFGRHYGIPSPLIDFSYSPYVATFFAFTGVRPYDADPSDKCAIYCVNLHEVAGVWSRMKGLDDMVDGPSKVTVEHNRFLNEDDQLFNDGYPPNLLKFIPWPASWNRRMRRQLGCFLYDSVDYSRFGLKDLEDFLSQPEAPKIPASDQVMLTKVLIPQQLGREVMERLDATNICATLLYDDHQGAAIDVINAYNYDRKSSRVWDLTLKPT
jgi:FRG domain